MGRRGDSINKYSVSPGMISNGGGGLWFMNINKNKHRLTNQHTRVNHYATPSRIAKIVFFSEVFLKINKTIFF